MPENKSSYNKPRNNNTDIDLGVDLKNAITAHHITHEPCEPSQIYKPHEDKVPAVSRLKSST